MKDFLKKSAIFAVFSQIFYFPNKSLAEPHFVFVSIAPQKYFVERIGGKEVEVETMVKSGESPATFNPNPKKMNRLANAKLYFSIGVPFEKIWISRIKALHPGLKFIPLNKTGNGPGHSVSRRPSREYSDPHIWTSPPLAKKMAAEINAALSTHKPEKAEFFQENFKSLAQDLDELDKEIREIIATAKTRSFMVFHPAWSYFAETYGLKQISIERQGKEPGPRALQAIINKGKKLKIKVIFVQKQFGLSIAKKVAKMIGASVREIDPLSENYLENMRQTAKAISGENL